VALAAAENAHDNVHYDNEETHQTKTQTQTKANNADKSAAAAHIDETHDLDTPSAREHNNDAHDEEQPETESEHGVAHNRIRAEEPAPAADSLDDMADIPDMESD
jgi:hypothetical protein